MRLQNRFLRRVLSATAVLTVAGGTAITGFAIPASAGTNPLCTIPALCSILPIGTGGALTLPSGLSSVAPTSITTAEAADPIQLVVTDPRAAVYNAAGGVSVTLTGPTSAASPQTYTGVVGTVSGDSVNTTFNLATGNVPPAPGAYTVNVGVASSSGLSTLLGLLGLSQLPLDTATLTIGSGTPTPSADLSVTPGGSVAATITTLTSVLFALGDQVSFTTPGGTAVPGLDLTQPDLSAGSITGTLTAAADVAPGTYNLVVTDLLGQLGICSGCVTVLGDLGGGGGGGGGGGITLPGGLSSVTPSTIKAAAASDPVQLDVVDPRAAIYNTAGGVSVTLTGPTGAASPQTYTGVVGAVTGDSAPTTFNLVTGGVPAAPGTYTVNVGIASASGLAGLLSQLGLSQLPIDTATLTIAGTPTPNADATLPAGGSVATTITTLTAVLFALGDQVSFTTPSGAAEPGLSLADPGLSTGSITGLIVADPDVVRGTYNLVVTDLLNQVGICQGCVTVTSDQASALALKLSKTKLAAGKSATLTGVLTNDGTPLSGQTVYLIDKTATSKVALLKTIPATSSTGGFSYNFKPAKNTAYAALFEGEATSLGKNLPALSNILGLTVTPKLTLHVVTTKVSHHKHGARMVFSGRTSSTEVGKTITILNNGKRFGTAKVRSNGTYRLVKKLVKRGHYTLRAKTKANTLLAAAQSSVVHKTVK